MASPRPDPRRPGFASLLPGARVFPEQARQLLRRHLLALVRHRDRDVRAVARRGEPDADRRPCGRAGGTDPLRPRAPAGAAEGPDRLRSPPAPGRNAGESGLERCETGSRTGAGCPACALTTARSGCGKLPDAGQIARPRRGVRQRTRAAMVRLGAWTLVKCDRCAPHEWPKQAPAGRSTRRIAP